MKIPSRLFVIMACAVFVHRVSAEVVVFTIDSSQTTISGTTTFNGSSLTAEKPGSNQTSAIGNFSVDIDNPLNPGSIRFLGGLGYSTLLNTAGGINLQPGNAPANLALQYGFGFAQVAVRGGTFDFSDSAPTSISSGRTFSDPTLTATALSGEYDYTILGSPGVVYASGASPVVPATGTLTESGGLLTLTLDGTVSFSNIVDGYVVTETIVGHIIANASFNSSNTAVVTDPSVPVNILGGASTVGGVTAQLGSGTVPGTLSVESIPTTSGLSYASLSGLSAFGITSSSQSINAWSFNYYNSLGQSIEPTGPITLTLHFNRSLLTPSQLADLGSLHIEHFDTSLNQWVDLGGIVDTVNDTITVTTPSLSQFVSVPEPSSILLAMVGLTAFAYPYVRQSRRTAR